MGFKSGSKSGKGGKSGSKSGKGGKSNGKLKSGRFQQLNTQNDSGSEEEPQIDSSALRPSIEVSVKGFTDLVKMFNGGTAEIKNVLANQCDLIYECKVCKNFFRNQDNFITHKRVYCRKEYCATAHTRNRTDVIKNVLANQCDLIYECKVCKNFFRNQDNFITHKRVYCRKEYCATAHTRNRTDVVEDYTCVIQPKPAPAGSPEARDRMTSDDSAAVVDVPSAHINTAIPPISTYSKPKKDSSKIVEKLGKKSSIQPVTETIGDCQQINVSIGGYIYSPKSTPAPVPHTLNPPSTLLQYYGNVRGQAPRVDGIHWNAKGLQLVTDLLEQFLGTA